MQILGTDAYRTALSEAIINSQYSISLISAYLTIEGVDWILERIPKNVNCKVLSRWNCSDLVSGASDVEVFERLKLRGYRLYILQDLHAKVINVDSKKLFLGSANITNSGLKLIPSGNKEIGTILIPDEQDLSLLEGLFNEGIFVSDHLYEDLRTEIQNLTQDFVIEQKKLKWSDSLQNKLRIDPSKLWVTEMLWAPFPDKLLEFSNNTLDKEVTHDLLLLGFNTQLSNPITPEILRKKFTQSRAWLWLENKLRSLPNNEMYYGQLSAELHNSFLDDPTPYRKDVKGLLTNLLNWSAVLCSDVILVDRPNHSQRVKIISKV